MKPAYDIDAPKRPVNMSLNGDLVDKARAMTGNLSSEVEALLADFVQRQVMARGAQAERLRRSVAAWNAFGSAHGSFADEFSTL